MSQLHDTRPVDHAMLHYAMVARGMGEEVYVLGQGMSGGEGMFRADELLEDRGLYWRRFYTLGGQTLIVPHAPALDALVGQLVEVERDKDGTLHVHVRSERAHDLAHDSSDTLPVSTTTPNPFVRSHVRLSASRRSSGRVNPIDWSGLPTLRERVCAGARVITPSASGVRLDVKVEHGGRASAPTHRAAERGVTRAAGAERVLVSLGREAAAEEAITSARGRGEPFEVIAPLPPRGHQG